MISSSKSSNRLFFNRYFPFIIYFFSLVVYTYLLMSARSFGLLPMPLKEMDQYTMLKAAADLYKGILPNDGYIYSPIYTLFLTVLIALSQGNLVIMRFLQAVFCALMPVLIYKLARRLRFSFEASQISALLYFFYGPAALLSLVFLRAVPLAMCFLLYVYVLITGFQKKKSHYFFYAGLLAASCIYGRPNFIPIVFFPVIFMLIKPLRKYFYVKYFMFFVAAMAVMIIPYMTFNLIKYQRFSTSPGHVSNIYYDSGYFGKTKKAPLLEVCVNMSKKIPQHLYEYTWSHEKQDSISYYSHREMIDFLWVLFIPCNILVIFTLFCFFYSYRHYGIQFIACALACYLVTMVLFPVYYRFRFPIIPLLAVCAGGGLWYIYKEKQSWKKGTLVIVAILLFFITYRNPDKLRRSDERRATVLCMVENKLFYKAEKYLDKLDIENIKTYDIWQELIRSAIKNGDTDLAKELIIKVQQKGLMQKQK